MVDNFLAGSAALFGDPFTIGIFIFGVIGGMLFGAIPGVSMLTLAAILLPFTASLEPAQGVMLFAVIYCTGTYGGAITAILFNIPGAPENAPTAFDGYPMTRKGQSGKAVGAAVLCSAIGGVSSALIMMAATEPLANWAISNIGPPEIFALVFFNPLLIVLSMFAGIIGGLLAGTLFLNNYRFVATSGQSIGVNYLAAGIAFVPAIMGFFAVSEIFVQAEKKAVGMYKAPKLSLDFPTILELWSHKIAVLRSMLVGFFCGILPGIGATLAAFMGYGEAVRWSKNKDSFGKGNIEGVISSETANNAATGAAMIPLLALGLPGGAMTALMVGVFQMHDLEPGPMVFYNSPDLIWIVFAAMFYANLSILFIGLIETKTILHLLKIPFQFLAPMILLLASIGSYIGRGLVLDVMIMFCTGIMGFLLRRSGYSIPGIVLGIILGKIGEQNFAQGMQMVHYDVLEYLSRPICLLLIIAGFLTLFTGIYKALSYSFKS